MIQPKLLRNPRRVAALAVMALVVGGQLSMFFLVVQYVQRVLGFGPMASGFAFLPLSLGIFAMSRFTPRLVARFGPAPLILLGTLGLTTSFVLLSQVGTGDTYAGAVFGPMLLNGLSAGLVFMPVTATALSDVEPEHAGAASGLLQTTQQLGSAIGVAAIVSVYAAGAVPGEFVPGRPGGVPHLRRVHAGRLPGRGRGAAARPGHGPGPAPAEADDVRRARSPRRRRSPRSPDPWSSGARRRSTGVGHLSPGPCTPVDNYSRVVR